MNHLKKKVRLIQRQINQLKRDLKTAIDKLPDNPNINRLGTNAFSMNISEVFASKTMILSPQYYDFKHQYKTLCKIIDNTELPHLPQKMEDIINTGQFMNSFDNTRPYTYKFHPKVIDEVKQVVENLN